ncbi:MAG: hypothetical protein WAN97_16875 [Candidatus Acidiferrales bacterium]
MAADETPTLTSPGVVDTVASSSRTVAAAPWAERLTWLLAWGTKGGLAVTDQALFAGAQFALNIMLARWLDPEDYGAFAVAYAVFLLAAAVHTALLIEPMIVFGSGRYLGNRRSYLGIVLRGHWLLTVPSGLVLLGVGFAVRRWYSPPVGHALSALGVALPLILLTWLTRRAFYIELQPGRAAAGGAIFLCGLLALLWWLHAEEMLTPGTAILATGVASLIAAGLHLVWLRPERFQEAKKLGPAEVASEHWAYGRWVLAAVLPSWTLLNFYYVVLPVWFGLKQAGELKAIMNLSMPAIHSLIAFGVLMIPLFVRHLEVGGRRLMRQTVRRVTSVFVAGAGAYFVLLWFFRIQIIHLLYGGKYVEDSGLPVCLVGLAPIATALTVSFGVALRAFERADYLFWANVAASAIAITLGLWLAASWGVLGATAGYVASYSVFAGASWFFYRKLLLEGSSA